MAPVLPSSSSSLELPEAVAVFQALTRPLAVLRVMTLLPTPGAVLEAVSVMSLVPSMMNALAVAMVARVLAPSSTLTWVLAAGVTVRTYCVVVPAVDFSTV